MTAPENPALPVSAVDNASANDDRFANQLPRSATNCPAWLITTWSGSRYIVTLDPCGQWWFGGRNRPRPRSVALPPQLWAITPPSPWPPVVGEPLILFVPPELDFFDPLRAPGGGKITSAVQEVESLPLAVALERAQGHDGN